MTRNDKVKFTGENSTPYQEREAKKVLEIGRVYEVERIIESNWFGFISLKGVKGQFAIEMFELIPSMDPYQ
jgi:hypothetical protein